MHAAQAAAIGVEQLHREELQERLQHMTERLGAANVQQDCLDRPVGSISRRTKDPEHPNTTPCHVSPYSCSK